MARYGIVKITMSKENNMNMAEVKKDKKMIKNTIDADRDDKITASDAAAIAKGSLKKAKGSAEGFRQFIKEQNVVGLAIGLVLGTAASALVNSLINNLLMPPLGLLLDSADGLKGLTVTIGATSHGVATLRYGEFINDLINFLVLALVIYWVVKILRLDIKKK